MGHYKTVKVLLEYGADASVCNEQWSPLLQKACIDGEHEIVQLLLFHGADPNFGRCIQAALEVYHQDIFLTLIDAGAEVNTLSKPSNLTPLMMAAKTNNTIAVEILLIKGADPNIEDEEGFTALTHAIVSENISNIAKLFKVTKRGLEKSFEKLGESSMTLYSEQCKCFLPELESEIHEIVNKNRNLFNTFLEIVAIFGNAHWLQMLLSTNPKLNEKTRLRILENVLNSDDAEACQILAKNEQFNLTDKLKKFAISRGKGDVIRVFNLDNSENSSIFNFFQARRISLHKQKLFEKVIKSEEFPYSDNISNVIEKWLKARQSNVWIKFNELLRELKAPEVHYQNDRSKKDCVQKQKCKRIRQTKRLVKDILNEMSKSYPIFKDPEVIIVGSMKEKTKIGEIDETDLLLLMNKKYRDYFKFDENKQQIEEIEKVPDELKVFVKNKVFDTTKYFHKFVKEIHRVISSQSVQLPEGLTLSTSYNPCEVCKNLDENQYIRCKHEVDCKEHLKKLQNSGYKENCSCRNYSSPSLTYTKIGVVLHLQFQEPDGSLFNLDVDVNPPTIHVNNVNQFNGSNKMKRKWLLENRDSVVNWRGEYWKSYDMSAAVRYDEFGNIIGGGTRSVRLRMVNKKMVIPEQVFSQGF